MAELFSTIGSALGGIWGPAGSAIGGAFGGLIDGNKAAKDKNNIEMNKFVRLREAAEKADIHVLEALRSGHQVGATTPRLQSSLSAYNAYDQLTDELTGEGAKARKRADVEDEIRERELQRLKIETANGQITKSTIGSNRPPKLPGSFGMSDFNTTEQLDANDVSAMPEHDGDLRAIQSEPEKDVPPFITVTLPDGTSYRVPNPELLEIGLGELAAGALIHGSAFGAKVAGDVAQEYKRGITKITDAQQNPTQKDIEQYVATMSKQIEKNYPHSTPQERKRILQSMLDGARAK